MRAFSLIEILVVIGMATILVGVSLPWNIDSYLRSEGRSDTRAVVAALVRARAESLASICSGTQCEGAIDHGVYISTNTLVLFEGRTYKDRNSTYDQLFTFFGRVAVPMEFVFAAQSGRVLTPGSISFKSKDTLVHSISVNSEGFIF